MNELNPTEILKYNMYDNNILLHNTMYNDIYLQEKMK